MHSLCPLEPRVTQGFLVNATPRNSTHESGAGGTIEAMLDEMRTYSLRLVAEDAPIFDSISFRRDCMTRSDQLLSYGMDYIEQYPRAHPGRQMIR